MGVRQREVYSLPHPISLDSAEQHPFIVLSTQESNYNEDTFVGVMITGSGFTRDDFSFDLTDNMFQRPLSKPSCHARMHLITLCLNEQIIGRKVNEMKDIYFRQLMATIGDLVFGYEFKPRQ